MGEDAAVCVDLCAVDCSHIDCVCWAEAEVLSYSFFSQFLYSIVFSSAAYY